ncbi:hypothetical protein CH54_1464 [Yersinia rochesterensis]|uniref:Uncharacterized protein n=1 Tax=Yersinia rochesterensis TaxID=1604335 RepID=A0ABN4FKN1_9GAMM|nr:hypothetical protein DJ57_2311 [Yersinia rochesterensis]AJI86139.1 hypothetical protein AW19_200 [Yersinia frederiksenii Y225]AJJ37675.1 hypothetical protein CH54_1464 [Yersinia rochesterensis]CNH03853.1 Uncharacterised protein [Yersinia kristensenii]CRY60212.1 Uncharacterised protein [Yersinia kristensenii]
MPIYPKSLELQVDSQQTNLDELIQVGQLQVSDSRASVQLTPMQFQGRRG